MDNEKLIELVRERSYLYNFEDKRHSDSKLKDTAWREIGKKLNASDKMCKKSWNALRDSFRRSMKRQRELKNGQSIYSKKWKYEADLIFLVPFIRERTTPSYNNNTETDVRDEADVHDDSSTEVKPSLADIATDPISAMSPEAPMPPSRSPSLIVPNTRRPTIRRVRRRIPKKTEEISSALFMKQILNKKEVDDIDTFFSSMAETVKKFSQLQRAIVKAQVFAVVSRMEIETLTSSQDLTHTQLPTSFPYSPTEPSAFKFSNDS